MALVLVAACYDGGPRSAGEGAGPWGGSGGIGADDADDDDADDGADAGGDAQAQAPPTRRLTRRQYNNVVADLLGDTTHPADALGPDARAFGYESNGEGELIAQLVAEQYELVADAVAANAVPRLPQIMGCNPSGATQDACVDDFIMRFGRRAYRRPLTGEAAQRLQGFYQGLRSDHDPTDALRLLIKAVLMSPEFLYRVQPDAAEVDDFTMASRLSFLLWNTMPDDDLLLAAEQGTLRTASGVAAQAERMLADPRAEDAIADFHRQWLLLDWVYTAAKDEAVFPEYTPQIQELLVAETEAFIAHTILQGEGDVAALLSSPTTFLNDQLATYYGLLPPGNAMLARVQLDPQRAAGVLTQGSFLAAHASSNATSPVRRGKFVRERLLCGEVPPPPPGVDVTPPEPTPGTTTRQRYAEHATDPVCAGCHSMMDPIGLGFEHYDAVGRWRDDEGGLVIDPTVELIGVDAQTNGVYPTLTALADALASSPTTRSCVAKQWFRYAYGRNDADERYAETLATLTDAFDASDGNIRTLIVTLTQTELFLGGR